MKIDATNLNYKKLNEKIHNLVEKGAKKLTLFNVNGQRYIASGMRESVKIHIKGIPGNDLGAFMNGPEIYCENNGQEAIGNTMSGGKIIINGQAGDALGYSMRGGKIFVKNNVGYRVGINMKQYRESTPVIVIGDSAKDFLGEYMAGGIIIVLGMPFGHSKVICGRYLGTGMHGGSIYLPKVKLPSKIPSGLQTVLCKDIYDVEQLSVNIDEFSSAFKLSKNLIAKIKNQRFVKIQPSTHRPYGNLYAY